MDLTAIVYGLQEITVYSCELQNPTIPAHEFNCCANPPRALILQLLSPRDPIIFSLQRDARVCFCILKLY